MSHRTKPAALSRGVLPAVLFVVAIALPPAAVWFARFAGASWGVAFLFGGLAILAVYLSSRAPTDEARAADLGRGVVVSIVLTIALAWVQHEGEQRAARDALEFSLASGKSFVGINLNGRDLRGFYLAGKDFREADFRNADLRGAVLRNATLSGADLEEANLAGADLREANVSGSATRLRGAVLTGADLTRAVLRSAQLAKTDLSHATLAGAKLGGSDLRGANLREALFTGADLRLALLTGADARGTIFSADLRSALLEGAALRNIKWDRTTRWPPKFNPRRPLPKPTPLVTPAVAKADVVKRVVDGDTLVLAGLGGVRLLGIDAPQPEARPAECYAAESSAVARGLLAPGEPVWYTLGVVPRDIFGRAQAYLWLANGTFVNEDILGRGAARVLISEPNVAYADRFRAAAVWAADTQRGLWRAC